MFGKQLLNARAQVEPSHTPTAGDFFRTRSPHRPVDLQRCVRSPLATKKLSMWRHAFGIAIKTPFFKRYWEHFKEIFETRKFTNIASQIRSPLLVFCSVPLSRLVSLSRSITVPKRFSICKTPFDVDHPPTKHRSLVGQALPYLLSAGKSPFGAHHVALLIFDGNGERGGGLGSERLGELPFPNVGFGLAKMGV